MRLESIVLSSREGAIVADNAEGINGKVNVTSDGRFMVVLRFIDDSNPFKIQRSVRVYSTNKDGKWSGATPAAMTSLIGKDLSKFVTMITAQVEPYEIEGRTVNIYTAAVFSFESAATVFKQLGHPLATERVVDKSMAQFDQLIESVG